jgi:mannose-1-phosphate guanylyltransferase
MYAVILAGGSGTRQHALGPEHEPTPFRATADGRSVLARIGARLAPLVDPFDVVVVTDRRLGQQVRDELPDARILVEPMNRNTAAALALATVAIGRPDDEAMLVVCADHEIERDDAFRAAIETVEREIVAGGAAGVDRPLVVFGVRPTAADPGFSWLQPRHDDGIRAGDLRVFPVGLLEPNPVEGRTRELYESGTASWAAGIFLWQRGAIRDAIERYTPLLTLLEPAHGSELALRAAYDRLLAVSIDEAILAGAARDGSVLTVALDVGWRDVGPDPVAGPS